MLIRTKDTTSQYPLRMHVEERALVEKVQEVYGAAGVTMTLNDTLRHLVRRAGIVLASTPEAAAVQLLDHCRECDACEMASERFGCPEGLYIYRSYRRVCRAHSGAQ